MDQAIVFVSHWLVRPGTLDRLRQLSQEVAARFQAEKPRTLSWLAYLDESGASISFVHCLRMPKPWVCMSRPARPANDLIEPRGWEIYGTPSDAVLDQMRRTAEAAGVTLRLEPELLPGGFLRLAAS